MTRCLRWLVLACCLTTVCCATTRPLFAQDAKPSPGADAPRSGLPDASETDEVQVESTAASGKTDKPPPEAPVPPSADDVPTTKSPEVFVPSEDISEDLAVSFPVDI